MKVSALAVVFVCATGIGIAQEEHSHPAPEKLGKVTFPTSCSAEVQPRFERAVALLHSFAYADSEKAFREVADADPKCAMAHWGVAMSYYHQLWEPISAGNLERGRAELSAADKLGGNPREKAFLAALSAYYQDAAIDAPTRAKQYSEKMSDVALQNPGDPEAQIFYALSLLGTASPLDKTHANQKHAAEILEPLYKKYPDHPGLAHYLIHAYDSTELASRGLYAAREYSKIAPSAPHALHMPSHIFTRLGYWDDSIQSNLAARKAAHDQGDIGEELHAMDYLTYAYLQRGKFDQAAGILRDLNAMSSLKAGDFKIGYAGTAMPVRYAVERQKWDEAARIQPLPGSAPHVAAIAYWARALGISRGSQPRPATAEIAELEKCLTGAQAGGNPYWTAQTEVLLLEAQAWSTLAEGKQTDAIALLRKAADKEDSVDKLPVTPGPIVPAREQLGEMLLQAKQSKDALGEFEAALKDAPRRRGALAGAAAASEQAGEQEKAKQYQTALR